MSTALEMPDPGLETGRCQWKKTQSLIILLKTISTLKINKRHPINLFLNYMDHK